MSMHVSADPVVSQNVSVQSSKTSSSTGTVNNMKAQASSDPVSIAQKSAEEAGQFVKDKKLKSRSKSVNTFRRSALTEKTQQLMKQAKDLNKKMDRNTIKTLLKNIMGRLSDKGAGGQSTSQLIQEQAANLFSDATEQYLALQVAHDLLQSNELGEELGLDHVQVGALKRAVQDAGDDLYNNNKAAVQSGFNITDEAIAYESTLGSANDQRELYRRFLVDYDHKLSTAYENISKDYPGVGFSQAVSFIRAAVTADLKSANASLSETELKVILKDARDLSVLENTHLDSMRIAERLSSPPHNQPQMKTKGPDILKILLNLQESPTKGFRDLGGMKKKFELDKLENDNPYFAVLNSFHEIISGFPMFLFDSEREHESLSSRYQSFYDGEVAKEEE
jgi:hypothetical protein